MLECICDDEYGWMWGMMVYIVVVVGGVCGFGVAVGRVAAATVTRVVVYCRVCVCVFVDW